MIVKIIIGILIGFFAGFFLAKDDGNSDSSALVLIIIAIASIGFVGSSFMFGGIFGLMAIGEIIVGYFIASGMFAKNTGKE
jgi:hypothetical protein